MSSTPRLKIRAAVSLGAAIGMGVVAYFIGIPVPVLITLVIAAVVIALVLAALEYVADLILR